MSAGVSTKTLLTLPAAGSQPVQVATPSAAKTVVLYSDTGNAVAYWGGSDVSATTGIPLSATEKVAIDVGDVGAVYLVGTQNNTIRVTTV